MDNKDERKDESDLLVVAHQIQAPLAAVKWTLSMLENGDVGKLTKDQLELVDKAQKSNARAIRFIEDLLSVTKLEYGGENLDYSLVPIIDVIHDTIHELSPVAKEKGVKIIVNDFKSESPLIEIDKEKIRSAFENILDNAIKYSGQDGSVVINLVKESTDVLISVDDSGIGISEEDESDLFKKFFRSRQARETGAAGTGLGLFIAKRIIEKHGGKIWFEDKKRDLHLKQSGARFSFTIPFKVIDDMVI